jgi:hypothetical protein
VNRNAQKGTMKTGEAKVSVYCAGAKRSSGGDVEMRAVGVVEVKELSGSAKGRRSEAAR